MLFSHQWTEASLKIEIGLIGFLEMFKIYFYIARNPGKTVKCIIDNPMLLVHYRCDNRVSFFIVPDRLYFKINDAFSLQFKKSTVKLHQVKIRKVFNLAFE